MPSTSLSPVRQLVSDAAAEFYFTMMPEAGNDAAGQARQLYEALAELLERENAWIFSERIFAQRQSIARVMQVRGKVLAGRVDAVPPTCLAAPMTHHGPVAGLQVHAIRAEQKPMPLRCWDRRSPLQAPAGRSFTSDGRRWLFVTGRSAPDGEGPVSQARHTFQCARCLLQQAGATMHCVARTWLWLDDILDWYGPFNAVRTRFFHEQQLIDVAHGTRRLPASTGVGLTGVQRRAHGDRSCTMDLIAMPGQEAQIRILEAAGEQESAFRYGSAFSRACIAPMPGGPTLFISGTAAIDAAGRTEHVGRIEPQIAATLSHVRALLAQAGCGDEQVLTSLIYCKTPAVQRDFERLHRQFPWPFISLIADVCRDDLLFEVEVTARI